MKLSIGDAIEVGEDHGEIIEIRDRAVWYESREDGEIRETIIGKCTWLPSYDFRTEVRRDIFESWSEKERRSRLVAADVVHVDITEVSTREVIANIRG